MEARGNIVLTKPAASEALCEALKKVGPEINFINKKIRAFKDIFCETLNSMVSIICDLKLHVVS